VSGVWTYLTDDYAYPFTKERDPIGVFLNEDVMPIPEARQVASVSASRSARESARKRCKDRFQTASEFLQALEPTLR
jgi:hypothetical protein